MVLKECPTPIGIKIDKNTKVVTKIGCGRYTCPYCGYWKKQRIQRRVSLGFPKESSFCIMWTFTVPLGYSSVRGYKIMDAWASFRRLMALKNYKFKFFWCKEFTIRGEQHFHVLIDGFLPYGLVWSCWHISTHKLANHVTFSDPKKIPKINNPAGYILKYLIKAVGINKRFRKGERRWGFSQDIPCIPRNLVKSDFDIMLYSNVQRYYQDLKQKCNEIIELIVSKKIYISQYYKSQYEEQYGNSQFRDNYHRYKKQQEYYYAQKILYQNETLIKKDIIYPLQGKIGYNTLNQNQEREYDNFNHNDIKQQLKKKVIKNNCLPMKRLQIAY